MKKTWDSEIFFKNGAADMSAVMTDTEAECRRAIWTAWLHEPWDEGTPYWRRLTAWDADPVNAVRAAEIQRNYIAAMQRDPKLD